jgi:hypothetical protein
VELELGPSAPEAHVMTIAPLEGLKGTLCPKAANFFALRQFWYNAGLPDGLFLNQNCQFG